MWQDTKPGPFLLEDSQRVLAGQAFNVVHANDIRYACRAYVEVLRIYRRAAAEDPWLGFGPIGVRQTRVVSPRRPPG
jgi:hypothetical protein